MAKPSELENVTWGTLEELLLTCAVNRYGTDCWESVAKEIQKRTSTFNFFTSQNCKQKYYDLKRRFATQTDLGSDAAGSGGGAAAEEGGADDASPWLDELRRRRIAELKRELERYNLSIVSLQLKVKRLSEEREKSLTENQKEASDLQKTEQREREDDRKEEEGNKPEAPSLPPPEAGADDGVPAAESAAESRSVNASNTADPKREKSEENGAEGAGEEKPVEPAADPPAHPKEETAKPAGEVSYNGSSKTIALAKEPADWQDLGLAKAEPTCDSLELVESVAELKGEEEEAGLAKETSEVQRSSRKKGQRKTVYLNSSGDEAENESAAGKSASIKSQPLADFLDVIRRHKLSSVFERRLESQETSNYKNMIRQHVDLATISTRLEQGQYEDSPSKLHRDLLLLATNATLFFPQRAPEHKAALELRQLVSNKLPHHHPSTPTNPPAPAAAPSTQQPQPKPEPGMPEAPADSPPLLKPKLLGPAIASRKRSSIASKPLGGEKKEKGKDQPEKPSWFSTVTKKRTRDQNFGSRSSGANTTNNKSSSDGPSSKGGSGNENPETKRKKKENNSNAAAGGVGKKKSAANFLNRIRSSSANTESNSKGGEAKKIGGKSSMKAKQKEGSNGEGSRRNVGRLSKRAAAVAGTGKRRRESGGGDGGKAEGAAAKKRSRK